MATSVRRRVRGRGRAAARRNRRPVAELDPRVEPRVYERDGFAITLWTYFEPVLARRHAARVRARARTPARRDAPRRSESTPHFTDRVAEAQQLVDNPAHTPELPDADRELLSNALRSLSRTIVQRSATEQLLHGEPHAGNVLRTKRGLLFTDLQTVCRGPIEFDIAHCSPIRSGPWHLLVPERSTCRNSSAQTIPAPISNSSECAGCSCWRWSRRGAGTGATNSRTAARWASSSSTSCEQRWTATAWTSRADPANGSTTKAPSCQGFIIDSSPLTTPPLRGPLLYSWNPPSPADVYPA